MKQMFDIFSLSKIRLWKTMKTFVLSYNSLVSYVARKLKFHLACSVSIAIVRVNWSAPDAKAETTVVTSASGGTGSTTRVSVAEPLPPPRIPSRRWPQQPQGISSCSRTDAEPLDSVLRPLMYIFYKIFHLAHEVSAASLVLLVQLVLQTCDVYEYWNIWRLGTF